jgi:hypothetical protein
MEQPCVSASNPFERVDQHTLLVQRHAKVQDEGAATRLLLQCGG